MSKVVLGALLFFFSVLAYAGMTFDDMTDADFDGLSKDFSALLAHTTVSPASGLLTDGAVELGLFAGTVTIPNVADIVARIDPDGAQTKMINLGALVNYSFSKSSTLETKWIPSLGSRTEGASFGSQSFALKYTFPTPKSATRFSAVRFHLTKGYVKSQQVINNDSTGNTDVDAKIDFHSMSLGLAWLASTKYMAGLVIFEPFYGVGYMLAKSDLESQAAGSASIFTTGGGSKESSVTGLFYFAGAQVHSYFTKLGIEYSRVFDSHRWTLKLSFGY